MSARPDPRPQPPPKPPQLPPWIAAELPVHSRAMVHVGDGLHVHVMEAGDPEGQPVLLVHGNPTWGYLWRKVLRELLLLGAEGDAARGRRGLRLVVPDLVGLGLSDKPRDPAAHRLDDHMRWMGQLVRALDLRAVTAVVQDWGGPVGVGAFLDQPERLAGLVALNTTLLPPSPGFRPTLFHRLSQLPLASDALFQGLGFPLDVMNFAQGDRRSMAGLADRRAYRWPLADRADRAAPLGLARMVPDSLAHPSVAPLERLGAFTRGFLGPQALIWGGRDPILGRLLDRHRRAMPLAAVHRTQAGHFLQEEVPGLIARVTVQVTGQVSDRLPERAEG